MPFEISPEIDAQIQAIKAVRAGAACGLLEAKNALDTTGSIGAAIELIEENRRATPCLRPALEGRMYSYTHEHRTSVIIEVRCERRATADSDDFGQLVHNIAYHLATADLSDPLLHTDDTPYYADPGITLGEFLKQVSVEYGENIFVRHIIVMRFDA